MCIVLYIYMYLYRYSRYSISYLFIYIYIILDIYILRVSAFCGSTPSNWYSSPFSGPLRAPQILVPDDAGKAETNDAGNARLMLGCPWK